MDGLVLFNNLIDLYNYFYSYIFVQFHISLKLEGESDSYN